MTKATIVCSKLSSNALGRAYVLAQITQQVGFETEIVGLATAAGIWSPLRVERSIPIREARSLQYYPGALRDIGRLAGMIDGDLIYVSKPLFSGLVPALLAHKRRGARLIVDIDDWELGFAFHAGPPSGVRLFSDAAKRPDSFLALALSERLLSMADAITVSNTFLQNRYGGTLLSHGREEAPFRSDTSVRQSMREQLGLTDRKVILFLGTPHSYKGVEDLVTAYRIVNQADSESFLLLVGLGTTAYAQTIRRQLEATLPTSAYQIVAGCDFQEVPHYMQAADVVVVPQRRTLATLGQMPVKLYDAMAAGKAIVSTDVSDIRATLGGAGWIVSPAMPVALAEAIIEALKDPHMAARRGALARERFINHYTISSLTKIFVNIKEVRELL